jgi:rod shape-determining protein MreD
MRLSRTVLATLLVMVALVLQVSVLARLQLPGAVPDLLLLTVLALALVYGHVGGALVGFGAGLLADLAPPADHAAGRYALVLCVVGYAAGLTKPETGRHRSATGPMVVVAAGAATSTLLYAGVGALVGDTAARGAGLTELLITATVYDLLLAPFTVPLVMGLARRVDGDPLLSGEGGSSGGSAAGGGGEIAAGLGAGTGLSTRVPRRRRRGRGPFGTAARLGGGGGGGGHGGTLLGRPARGRAGRLRLPGVRRL